MSNLWGPSGRPILGQVQCHGVPDSLQEAWNSDPANADNKIGGMWYDMQMMIAPINTRGVPQYQPDIIRNVMHADKVRMPFNWLSFYRADYNPDNGPVGRMHPVTEQWLDGAVAHGVAILWCNMDGPSQRPAARTRAEWLEAHVTNRATCEERYQLTWHRLMNFLQIERPELPLYGFELMNEPAAFSGAVKNGAATMEEAMGIFLDYLELQVAIIKANYPAHPILVPGWRYNADFGAYDETFIPARGKTAKQAIHDIVGPNLIWSWHHYGQWIEADTWQSYWQSCYSRVKAVVGERVICSEYQSNPDDDIFTSAPFHGAQASLSRRFLSTRVINDFCAEYDFGLSYWVSMNYAGGKWGTNYSASPRDWAHNGLSQYGHGLNGYQMGQNPIVPRNHFGTARQQDSAGDLEMRIRSVAHPGPAVARNIRLDEAMPLRYTQSFGGRGLTIHTSLDDAVNFHFGDVGKSVQYGGDNMGDLFFTGLGGGVIHCGRGANIVKFGRRGVNRVFLGPDGTFVDAGTGLAAENTVIAPAEGTGAHDVFAFDEHRGSKLLPAPRGDRLFLRRMFATPSALHAATFVSRRDLVIAMPGGGILSLTNRSDLHGKLHDWVLDFAQSSWEIPVDYMPAEVIDNPIPDRTIPDTIAYLGEIAGRFELPSGARKPLSPILRDGRSVTPRHVGIYRFKVGAGDGGINETPND